MEDRSPLKVLLVEDSAVLADRLGEMLRQIPGITLVETVDTEADAVSVARAQAIDVMILDLHLRKGTGFGVLRTLATEPHGTTTIVLTNYALPQYRTAATDLGVRYFLDKAREFGKIPDLLREIAFMGPHINRVPAA
jgi:DNA-binding NarL/FixJ family response regulator